MAKWSRYTREMVKEALATSRTMAEAAAKLGCHPKHVGVMRKRFGLPAIEGGPPQRRRTADFDLTPPTPKASTAMWRLEAWQMAKDGLSNAIIAEWFGRSEDVVRVTLSLMRARAGRPDVGQRDAEGGDPLPQPAPPSAASTAANRGPAVAREDEARAGAPLEEDRYACAR